MVSLTMDAEAKWTRTHAFDCKTLGGTPIDMSFALFNDSTTQNMVALCAVSDTDYFLHIAPCGRPRRVAFTTPMAT